MKLTKYQKSRLLEHEWDVVETDEGQNCSWISIEPQDGKIFHIVTESNVFVFLRCVVAFFHGNGNNNGFISFQVENWGAGKGRVRRNPNKPLPELNEARKLSEMVHNLIVLCYK